MGSRRLSSGDVATEKEDLVGGPRMRTGSLIPFSVAALAMWRSGEGQITKPDNPPDSGWVGGWRRGTRALSESEGSSSILSWLTGSGKDKTLLDQSLQSRRGSSKDIEEAMAGGLSKADLYMPPI